MNIEEIKKSYNTYYRFQLGSLINAQLTNFSNEIFFIMKNDNKKEIGMRRIVFDLEEKYLKEYGLEDYIGNKIGFFTGTFIAEKYRNNGYGTDMFNIGLERFEELNQDYVFSDARKNSLNIFLKNGFKIIGERISLEGNNEVIVIKKLK